MDKTILLLAIVAATSLAGCGSMGPKIEAGRSGCNPDSPQVLPFTPQFKECKRAFPALAAEYKAKEERLINGECSVWNGDICIGKGYVRDPRTGQMVFRTWEVENGTVR